MTKVLVIAGGQSEEHEVSITSANALMAALKDTDLDPTVLVVTREGKWLGTDDSQKALAQGSVSQGGELTLHKAKVAGDFDVVFPIIHGTHGEDGTIQGMLELAHVPYVGSGVLASALCMDKPMSKDVLRAHGISQVDYALITRHEFTHNQEACLERCKKLNGPWFVKPANLGSSVGISKAKSTAELQDTIALALKYDRRVIVEEALPEARELEVGILGNDAPQASPVGEITFDSEFYDYDTKYTDGKAQLHIPADIPAKLSERIQSLATQAFVLLDCAGYARVDFFYQTATDRLILNEVNTIPGFTPLSMFAKMWEAGGLSYPNLVQRLIELALERHRS